MKDANGWQPIETAPKDGHLILAASVNHSRTAVVGWREGDGTDGILSGEGHWDDVGAKNATPTYYFNGLFFTHWQPLPAAPVQP